MSLLVPDSGLLFWMLLSFGIVFCILAKFGFPVIVKMVENRQNYIDQSLQAAKQANEQLAKVKESSDALIAQANREQGRILREAAAERDKIVAQAQEQARQAGEKELEEMRRLIEREKDKAIMSIRSQVAVLSVQIAEKVIRQKLSDSKEQSEMLDRMIDQALQEAKES